MTSLMTVGDAIVTAIGNLLAGYGIVMILEYFGYNKIKCRGLAS